jgi:hypothetical protein
LWKRDKAGEGRKVSAGETISEELHVGVKGMHTDWQLQVWLRAGLGRDEMQKAAPCEKARLWNHMDREPWPNYPTSWAAWCEQALGTITHKTGTRPGLHKAVRGRHPAWGDTKQKSVPLLALCRQSVLERSPSFAFEDIVPLEIWLHVTTFKLPVYTHTHVHKHVHSSPLSARLCMSSTRAKLVRHRSVKNEPTTPNKNAELGSHCLHGQREARVCLRPMGCTYVL